MGAGDKRLEIQDATVAAVYRHACNDAAAAAIAHDWQEWTRLLEMARMIERAYPSATTRARFAAREPSPAE